VSDFYIPKNELPEHKIQSNCDGLTVSLKPVPKCLGKLRAEWCPEAFIVSFKLETDKEILDFKCKKSLASYKQDLVIGNILEDRKNSVSIMNSQGVVHIIMVNSESKDIEEDIIEYLYSLHSAFIEKKS
jgi:phosphopantothenate-cysteine ligase